MLRFAVLRRAPGPPARLARAFRGGPRNWDSESESDHTEASYLARQFPLRGGRYLPSMSLVLGAGFGPETTRRVVKTAVRAGYRALDLSNGHPSEALVGQALAELIENGEVSREDLWITAKLWNSNHRFVTQALKSTLDRLRLRYVDAYLIGWPQACPATGRKPATSGAYLADPSENSMFPVADDGSFCSDNASHFVETWHRMEDMVSQERARTVGLCNFNSAQLREVCREAYIHQPSILQAERHPYLQNAELLRTCRELGVQFQATVPTGSFDQVLGGELGSLRPDSEEAVQDPAILAIAREHTATPSQVILRWHLQSGVAVCPKAWTDEEIRENAEIWHPEFELSPSEMRQINALDRHCRHLLWPETSAHPDYPFRDELPKNYHPGKPRGPAMRTTFQHRHNSSSGKYGPKKIATLFK